ncbi:hypothetical protein QCA50_018023 [Cerrena zonata]|uniref:Uncharacterized protein n=1 Tax=Cerrena zonata TaxID=2478898 RepID=A0AAW0FDM5_9APHY
MFGNVELQVSSLGTLGIDAQKSCAASGRVEKGQWRVTVDKLPTSGTTVGLVENGLVEMRRVVHPQSDEDGSNMGLGGVNNLLTEITVFSLVCSSSIFV